MRPLKRMWGLPLAMAALSMCASSAAHAAETAQNVLPKVHVEQFKLPNGLEVLVVPRHATPIVSVQVAYHVGSKDEPPGKRGMAHMFEHFMFKGTTHVPPEMHARMLDSVGGQDNAYTTEDVTVYHEDVPREQLGFALELEAERMRNLVLLPSTIHSEREVVKNERHWRVDDNPLAQALLLMRRSAFQVHPYKWDPIGENADLDSVTLEECRAFYDRFYQPGNATLAIVGDVEPAEVRKLVEQRFSGIPKASVTAPSFPAEPPQKSMVEKTLIKRVQLPFVLGGFHTPPARSPDMRVLEVLTRILGNGHSSRLYQRLIRKDRLAVEAGGFLEPLEHPGIVTFYAAHLPKVSGAQVKQALIEEIERIRTEGVTPAELEKAKNQLLHEHVRKLEHVGGMASELLEAQYIEGDWQSFLGNLTRLQTIQVADVKRVAEQYLSRNNLTLVMLIPESGGAK